MGDQGVNSKLLPSEKKKKVASSTSINKFEELSVKPVESPIFNGIMAVICATTAGFLMWVVVDGRILRDGLDDDFDSIDIRIGMAIIHFTTWFTITLASYFTFLAIVACCNFSEKLVQKRRSNVEEEESSQKVEKKSKISTSSPCLTAAEEVAGMV